MKKQVLKTDEVSIARDLKKIETSAQRFQPLLDAMIENDYAPTLKEFCEIVYGKKTNALSEYLREKTVRKYPAIDTLPITEIKKREMIELPKVCEAIVNIYNLLPAQTAILSDVYKMELIDGKVCIAGDSKQAIIDSHTVYANEHEYNAFEKASEVLNALIDLQENFGIDFFTQNVIQRNNIGTLKGATLRAEGVKMIVSQFIGSHNMAK